MNENTLLKIALVFSLIGILLLLFISERMEVPYKKISDINKDDLEDSITLKGITKNVVNTNNITIIDLEDGSGEITVIVFEDLELNNNQKVQVIGKVTEYEGTLEITADEIKILK